MHALITNDDGIGSPGLVALAAAAARAGLSTTTAAPATEASGTGASLTTAADHHRVPFEEHPSGYALPAHPGLITLIAARGGFGPVPEIVLSGINLGANLGRAIIHSGTVGAALTAGVVGIRAVAFSLDTGFVDGQVHWETAASVFDDVFAIVADTPPGSMFNVNVPNVPVDELRGIRWARLAEFGSVQSVIERLEDGTISVTTVETDAEPAPDTDAALLAAGYVTVTAIRSVHEDPVLHGAISIPPRWPARRPPCGRG
ncbi:5'/3'-nucleotidase SurE [Actinokineospora enzanensis]|uniref:5'/3'-nucleotidase SurE n=1 Tax=Actinokineospora enzanensis TaxID=155975 RepID=UPI00037C831E|nr:5'/3'-nucleotidase SurE [Actinokineospora enzanensis]